MAASLVNTACDNSKDIEGTLERVDLLSEITIEQTVYHTGSGSMCRRFLPYMSGKCLYV